MRSLNGVVGEKSSRREGPKLSRITKIRLLEGFLGSDAATTEIRTDYLLEAESLAAKLAGPSPTEGEELLAEMASDEWLLSKLLLRSFANVVQTAASPATINMLQEGMTRTSKRLCLAIDTMTRLRGLDVRLQVVRAPEARHHG